MHHAIFCQYFFYKICIMQYFVNTFFTRYALCNILPILFLQDMHHAIFCQYFFYKICIMQYFANTFSTRYASCNILSILFLQDTHHAIFCIMQYFANTFRDTYTIFFSNTSLSFLCDVTTNYDFKLQYLVKIIKFSF